MQYGDILRKLRSSKGLSQKELTDRLQINRSTYARYETSSTQPDFETLAKLSDFYDVSVDYILGREEKKSPSWSHEAEFEEFLNDPKISKLYSEYKESSEERREALFAAWEYLKSLEKK